MAFDKEYYDGKKRDINVRYVKRMEDTIDILAKNLNQFFEYKAELNEKLTDISKAELTESIKNNQKERDAKGKEEKSEEEKPKEEEKAEDDKSKEA